MVNYLTKGCRFYLVVKLYYRDYPSFGCFTFYSWWVFDLIDIFSLNTGIYNSIFIILWFCVFRFGIDFKITLGTLVFGLKFLTVLQECVVCSTENRLKNVFVNWNRIMVFTFFSIVGISVAFFSVIEDIVCQSLSGDRYRLHNFSAYPSLIILILSSGGEELICKWMAIDVIDIFS